MNATLNTVDNTITIKPAAPVDAATFARLRAAGFAWRMASGDFVAADSDQARTLAAELAGHIETTPPEALQGSGEAESVQPSGEKPASFDSKRFYSDLLEILTPAGWAHNPARQYFETDRFCMLDHGIGAGDGWSEWRIYINRWNLGNGGGFVPATIINAEHKTTQQVAAEIIAATTPTTSGEKPAPTYSIMHNVGRAKYVVNYHDGQKTHADGSPFFDVEIFSNKRRMNAFVIALRALGYSDSKPTMQPSGEATPPPTPAAPKIQTIERRGRDGETRVYLAHLPKGCTELYPLQYSQPGIQAQRIAKLRAGAWASGEFPHHALGRRRLKNDNQ